MYRANGVVSRVGDCPGNLVDPPSTVTVRVGQDVDVRMVQQMTVSGSLVPAFPIPSTSNEAILRRVAVADDGVTVTFRAEEVGTAAITTVSECDNDVTLLQTFGTCPVLSVTVIGATSS
jgi:hypothetical protein